MQQDTLMDELSSLYAGYSNLSILNESRQQQQKLEALPKKYFYFKSLEMPNPMGYNVYGARNLKRSPQFDGHSRSIKSPLFSNEVSTFDHQFLSAFSSKAMDSAATPAAEQFASADSASSIPRKVSHVNPNAIKKNINGANNNDLSRENPMKIQTGGLTPKQPFLSRQMSPPGNDRSIQQHQMSGPSGNSSPLSSNADQSTTLPSHSPPQRNGANTSQNPDAHYAESNADRRSLSQFNPATLDTHSVQSRRTLSQSFRCGSCSNLNSGALVLYDPMQQALVPAMTQPPPQYLPQTANPYWAYSAFPPPPPPFYFGTGVGAMPQPPPDFETFRQAMKMEKKLMKEAEKMKGDSACVSFCCGGVAQLLWLIIAITCIGFFAAFILALFVI